MTEKYDAAEMANLNDAELDILFGSTSVHPIALDNGNTIEFKLRKFRVSEFNKARFLLSAVFGSEKELSETVVDVAENDFDKVVELIASVCSTSSQVINALPLEIVTELLVKVIEVNASFFPRLTQAIGVATTLADQIAPDGAE